MANLEWGDCELDPEPDIRKAEFTADDVQRVIARGMVNFNPATGSHLGCPEGMGFQPFSARGYGRRQEDRRIFDSLDEQGQIAPVLLWAINEQVFIAYGGTRTMWAVKNEQPLKAVIVDYDNRFEGTFRKIRNNNAIGEWSDVPMGVVPSEFGWIDGKWYRPKSFKKAGD